MKKLIVISFLLSSLLWGGQETMAAQTSPAANAMAGGGIALLQGVSSIYVNPAGIALSPIYKLQMQYNSFRYFINSWFHNVSAAYKPTSLLSFSLGFSFFNSGDMILRRPGLLEGGGSLTIDEERYVSAGDNSTLFQMNDIHLSMGAAISPSFPLDLKGGILLKMGGSSVDSENSFYLGVDSGILLTFPSDKVYRFLVMPYIVPTKIGFVVKNFGFQTPYLEGNKLLPTDWNGLIALSFSPPWIKKNRYKLSYGFEIDRHLGLNHHQSHFFILPKILNLTLRTGVDFSTIATQFGFATGFEIERSFKNIPMKLGYSFEYRKESGLNQNFFYSATIDVIPVSIAVKDSLKKITKLLEEGNYKKAYSYISDVTEKIGANELIETKKRLEYLLAEEKDLFFLEEPNIVNKDNAKKNELPLQMDNATFEE